MADRKAWKRQASPHQPPGPRGTDTNAQDQPSTEMLSPIQVPHLSSKALKVTEGHLGGICQPPLSLWGVSSAHSWHRVMSPQGLSARRARPGLSHIVAIIGASITPLFACWVPLSVGRVRGGETALGLPGSVPQNHSPPLTTVYVKHQEEHGTPAFPSRDGGTGQEEGCQSKGATQPTGRRA